MTRHPAVLLLALTLAGLHPPDRPAGGGVGGDAGVETGAGEVVVVVRNRSFSTFSIAVLEADGHEAVIGQAPPDFANTLYVPADEAPRRLRFRARLRGSGELVHESRPVDARAGTRLSWSLPDNLLAEAPPPPGRTATAEAP